MIDTYNAEVDRWQRRENRGAKVDDFVDNDEAKIKWSEGLKKEAGKRKDSRICRNKNPTISLPPVHEIKPLL